MIKIIVRGNYIEFTKKKLSKTEISKGIDWINNYKQTHVIWEDSSSKEMNDFYDWITKESESVIFFNTGNLYNSSPFFGVRVFDESNQLLTTAKLSEIDIENNGYRIWEEKPSDGDAFSASYIYDFELCFLVDSNTFDLSKLKFVCFRNFLAPNTPMGSAIMYDGNIINRTNPTKTDMFPFDKKNPNAGAFYYDGFFICQNNEYYITYKCGGLERFCPTRTSAPIEISIMTLNGGFGTENFPRPDYVLTESDRSRFLKQFSWQIINGDITLQSPIGKIPGIPKNYNYEKEDIFKYQQTNIDAYFKIQKDFLNGIFYDLSDEKQFTGYAFILLFDLISSFKYNKSLPKLNNQLSVLVKCCPKISNYIDDLIVESIYYDLKDDVSKYELLQCYPDCKKNLNIYEYAKVVQKLPEEELHFIKGFSLYSISLITLSKTNEKKFKVNNHVVINMFFHMLAYVAEKYDDFDSLIEVSLKLITAHKKKNLSGKRLMKKKARTFWPYDKHSFYMNLVYRFQNVIYKKLNITNIGGNYEWPGESMGLFSAVQFEEYLSEAINCYEVCI